MLLNIREQIDNEIEEIIDKLILHNSNFKIVDDFYVEVDTPFIVCPDSRNDEWKTKIGLVFYPELLHYDQYTNDKSEMNDGTKRIGVTCPWVCCRFELENPTNELISQICPWIIGVFKEIGLKPFYDEDAYRGHFRKEDKKGYIKFKFYINPSFPDGYWQNHTL